MKYIVLLLILFLSGCSVKNYEKTQTKIVILKSPKMKFADVAYLRNTHKAIELEMFMAGHAVEQIHIHHLICVRAGCLPKSIFNTQYLHSSYPNELLQNILLGEAIYEGRNTEYTEDGFIQRIQSQDVNIEYKVTTKMVSFKDKTNRIILKIKDTK